MSAGAEWDIESRRQKQHNIKPETKTRKQNTMLLQFSEQPKGKQTTTVVWRVSREHNVKGYSISGSMKMDQGSRTNHHNNKARTKTPTARKQNHGTLPEHTTHTASANKSRK
jgi:hypothetical protein